MQLVTSSTVPKSLLKSLNLYLKEIFSKRLNQNAIQGTQIRKQQA